MRVVPPWPDGLPMMAAVLPAASIGPVEIAHFLIKPEDERFSRMRAANPSSMGRGIVRAGDRHAMLKIHGHTVMSDVRDERLDHLEVIRRAKGDVLIGGLGLGMVTLAVLMKPEVQSVTVIELDLRVINLVEAHLLRAAGEHGRKLNVVCGNMLDWRPQKGQTYDTIWFDIWPDICADSLPERRLLMRRVARRVRPGGYRGCWAQREVLRAQLRWGG